MGNQNLSNIFILHLIFKKENTPVNFRKEIYKMDLVRKRLELEEDVSEQKLTMIRLHDYKEKSAFYSKCSVKMPEDFCGYMQIDEVWIFNEKQRRVDRYSPHLDPYVQAKDNILSVTSDGECWIYDFDKMEHLNIEMPIVAFYHNIYETDENDNEELANCFVITGVGCPWGFESYEIAFKLYIDKENFKLVKDIYIEPEGETWEYCSSRENEDDEQ